MSSITAPNPKLEKKLFSDAIAQLKKDNLFEAEALLAQAISYNESNPEYWLKMGIIWARMGRYQQSIEANSMVLALKPEHPDALYNIGLNYFQCQQDDQGIDFFQKSYHVKPSEELAENIGALLYEKRDYKGAAFYFFQIYKTRRFGTKQDVLYKLAQCFYQNGDMLEASGIMIHLVKSYPQNISYINLLLDLYRRVPHTQFDPNSKAVVEVLLKKDNIKLLFLRNPWVSLFLLDPSYEKIKNIIHSPPSREEIPALVRTLKSDFICLGLQRGLAVSAPIENIMSNLRRYFAMNWQEAESWPEDTFIFLSSLAVCCWYNDYVYYETSEEKQAVQSLKMTIIDRINSADVTNNIHLSSLIALLSCYEPLYEFFSDGEFNFIPKKYRKDFQPLLTAQFEYPMKEKELLKKIKSFSTIDDKTSLSVQDMYSARPYPRWISSSMDPIPAHLAELTSGLEILVAGCGTGHEPALYSNAMPKGHITAIDLSCPSIAYAKRMAIQLGYDDKVDFYHGDLMKVEDLNKKFDFIASSGVLHHLREPEKGLEAILKTLKPDGRLSISLYSKYARDYLLNPATSYISEKGYSSSTDDIRQFRQDVVHMPVSDPITRCTTASDFFFLSECNDLLFHVQEHRYTPHMIWDMAERHGLVPIHVSMTQDRQKAFQGMFPEKTPLDPDVLTQFEEAHPKAFIEMYKIFFRWKDSTTPQPIDKIILSNLV